MSDVSAFKLEQVMSVALAFAARLREQDPSIAEDEASFLLALESETDAMQILTRVLQTSVEAGAMADAADARVKNLVMRRDRFKKRRDEARAVAFGILDALELTKFKTSEFTVGIRPGSVSLSVFDPEAVPSQLMIQPPAVPDNAAIKKALQAGEHVPGCELQTGLPTLSIRTM